MSEFDKFAKKYDDNLDKILTSSIGTSSDYFAEYKIKEIFSFFKGKKTPEKILDFGCGIGKNSVLIKKYFPDSKVYGIDISKDSIEIANKRRIIDCNFKVYDGQNIEFEDDCFDVIFISNVFHHIEHSQHLRILELLKRKLSINGYIFIFEHNTMNPLTLKIVNECEFDIDAKLLPFWYTKNIFKYSNFKNVKYYFILFIPPYLKKILFLERFLKWLPFGGQYYVVASK